MSRIHQLCLGLALLLGLLVSSTQACGTYGQDLLSTFTNGDSRQQASMIQTLRDRGPQGLASLQRVREQLLAGEHAPQVLAAVNDAMDQVAQQRYGHVSGLYWYTDLEAAKKQATATNRPILSLRMLGKLTEEYSCANSRFFRVLLYADPAVNNYLRDHFVLHWQSVRDVPQVTVTLSDGSTMRRTITGNSAHLVMNADGLVVHIIPGLWQPAAFLGEVTKSHQLAVSMKPMARPIQIRMISRWHGAEMSRVAGDFNTQLASLQLTYTDIHPEREGATVREVSHLDAPRAMPMAASKAMVEAPLVQPITLTNVNQMWQRINDAAWQTLARSQQSQVSISRESMSLIEKENPAITAVLREQLVRSLASDTAFNHYILGQEIHRWFVAGAAQSQSDDAVTAALYRDIFAMDLSDPWAGLHDPAVYTGLEKGGMQSSTSMSLRNTPVE